MALNTVTFPYEYVANPVNGRPLALGYIYIGVVNTDPTIIANQLPITARQQDGTEITIPQPISINSGGLPEYNGQVVMLLVDGEYSILIQNQLTAQQYYLANANKNIDASSINILGADGNNYTLADLAGNDGTNIIGYLNNPLYLRLQRVRFLEDFVGVDGSGVNECATPINVAIEYCRINRLTLFGFGKYNVAEKIVFNPGGVHNFSMLYSVDNNLAANRGFVWSGGNNQTIVEIGEIQNSWLGTINVAGGSATGNLGILHHNLTNNGTLGGHNVIERFCVQNCKYGVRIGDFTNDGYDSNVEQNVYKELYFYAVDNPLLIDSDGQDLIKINNFNVGGGTLEGTRDYLIKALRNGNQMHIDYGFGRSDGATVDTNLIDILDGSIYLGDFSIEGTGVCKAVSINQALARGQSEINLVVSDGTKNSSNVTAYFQSKSGVKLNNCVFPGDVQIERYSISSNNTIFSGSFDFIFIGTGSVEEINTQFRVNQASEITVGSERTRIRRGNLLNTSLLTVNNAIGKQVKTATAAVASGTPYNFATFNMNGNARCLTVKVDLMLGRASNASILANNYTAYFSACTDSSGNLTVGTPVLVSGSLAQDGLTPALALSTNINGTNVELRVTQTSGATLGAIFVIESMSIINNSAAFNSGAIIIP